jgi:hypothetical protein
VGDPAKLLTAFQDIMIAGASNVTIVVGAVASTYVLIVTVALFHSDRQRRADARTLLLHHRLTRALRKRDG